MCNGFCKWVKISYFFMLRVFFRLHYMAYGISVLQPGIEPAYPALKALILNHWTTRKVPKEIFKYFILDVVTNALQTLHLILSTKV